MGKYSLQGNSVHKFILPVDAKLLFGEGAFQLPSGQSIVVATKNHVYKLIIEDSNITSFLLRLGKWEDCLAQLDCACLPASEEGGTNQDELCRIHESNISSTKGRSATMFISIN